VGGKNPFARGAAKPTFFFNPLRICGGAMLFAEISFLKVNLGFSISHKVKRQQNKHVELTKKHEKKQK
jgi:hypothetical protein